MDAILLKQAMVGTDRPLTPNPLEETPGRIEAVESLCETISSDSAAWRLLLKAGCYAVVERTGFEPEMETDPRPKTSSHDERPAMNSKIVDILFEFLKEYPDQPQVVLHLLRKLEEKRLVFPVETLSRFLDVLSQRRLFKEEGLGTISKLLGERGRWLAGKNPDWRWASDHPVDETATDLSELEEIWNEGTFSERKTVLQILVGRAPKSAKRFVTKTWKNDKAEHREAFLSLLENSFDDSDIEFLEASLSDRSKNVRKIAAVCLARLPNSDFSQRIRKRAENILHLAGAPAHSTPSITPLAEFTKDMKADGFEEKPPQGVGEKSWWTAEVLKLVPPVFWEKRFGMTPSQILAALAKDDYFSSVLYAWTISVQHFADHDHWIEPLWDAWNNVKPKSVPEAFQLRDVLVKVALGRDPVGFWKKLRAGEQGPPRYVHDLNAVWIDMIQNVTEPWEDPFTETILDYLESPSNFYGSLKTILPFLPAATRPRVHQMMQRLEDSQKQPGYYTNYIDQCREILRQCDEFDNLLNPLAF